MTPSPQQGAPAGPRRRTRLGSPTTGRGRPTVGLVLLAGAFDLDDLLAGLAAEQRCSTGRLTSSRRSHGRHAPSTPGSPAPPLSTLEIASDCTVDLDPERQGQNREDAVDVEDGAVRVPVTRLGDTNVRGTALFDAAVIHVRRLFGVLAGIGDWTGISVRGASASPRRYSRVPDM